MTNNDLYGKWTSQEPVGLTEEQLDSAYSSVKGKIRRAESASLAIKLSEELRVRRQRRIIRILSAAVAAACLILPVVIVNVSRHSYEKGLSAQVNDEAPQMLEYSANAGEMRHVLLPDSTSVTLNAGTVLICPAEFIGSKRGVYLNGEATFDVTRNEKKPFVVSTSVMDITVLGTKFNVSSYSDDENVTATLCRGSISALTKMRRNLSFLPRDSGLSSKEAAATVSWRMSMQMKTWPGRAASSASVRNPYMKS